MTTIRDSYQSQVSKNNGELDSRDMRQSIIACSGECWDCDSCGGAQTH